VKRIAECCCGQLKLMAAGDPVWNGMCHCDNCRKRTGSAFGLSAYFKSSTVQINNGEASVYKVSGANFGGDQLRYFCKNCGTTLYWTMAEQPDLIGVAAGCFVTIALDKPTYSASTENKHPWVKLPLRIKKQ